MVVLVTVAGLFSILITLPNTPQIQALGDSQYTQTSCIDNQPCQTVVCSETQPCRISQSPNTDLMQLKILCRNLYKELEVWD